ncbi:SAM-dependent methyltransferase [Actinopolymorpha sp. B11F2]|uniref:SAM-dependent methyltransferase n=1 Tax=Actinopolymorpha sp. B11F2 TaxID=3160862 RepID=UPI0032E3DC90
MSDTEGSLTPTPAGVYDAALGGTANTAADRAVVERAKEAMPDVILAAWANRGFLQRAVRRMAHELGIRQFLDLGSGMPTQRNTHEVVAEARPDGRVVYVDVNQAVVARSREILAGASDTTAIQGDIRQPEAILAHEETRRLIDFTQPVGVLAVAVTHFLPDEDDPWGLIAHFMDAVPAGSYLALSAVTSDYQEETWRKTLQQAGPSYDAYPRTRAEVERFFKGLEIQPPYEGADPAVVHIGLWGAEDPEVADDDSSRLAYAALARKR